MTRVYFENHGQAVMHIDFNEKLFLPRIMNPKPHAADLQEDDFIVNHEDMKIGGYVMFLNANSTHYSIIKHPIERIEKMYDL